MHSRPAGVQASWTNNAIGELIRNLRYAVRSLRASPEFTAVALLSLTLDLGANTAIFTLIDVFLLQPLPMRDPSELFALTRSNTPATSIAPFNYPFYRELSERRDLFAGVFCERTMAPSLSMSGSAERVSQELVSGSYFDVLGLKPHLGRLLHPYDETQSGVDRFVVLGYSYWKRRFGGSAGAIRAKVTLSTTPMTVVGVAPQGFDGLRAGLAPDIYTPITMWPWMFGDESVVRSQSNDWFQFIVCRLKPEIGKPQSEEAALTTFYRSFTAQNDSGALRLQRPSDPLRVSLVPAGTGLRSRATNTANQLYVLMAVVGIVLIAACVNLANLLLARTAARGREIAIRLSIGASRASIVRQLMTEAILVSGLGGVLGICLAFWGAEFVFDFLFAGQFGAKPRVAPDWRVFGFALAVSLLTAMLFGLAPALRGQDSISSRS